MAASNITSPYPCEAPSVGASDYVQKIDRLAQTVDAHDHSAGKGAPIARVASGVADNTTIEVSSGAVRLKAGGIGTTHLADGIVTAAKMADDAISGDNVIDASIPYSKMTAKTISRGTKVDFTYHGTASSATQATFTGLTKTVDAVSKPLRVSFDADSIELAYSTIADLHIYILRDGVQVKAFRLPYNWSGAASSLSAGIPSLAFSFIDDAPGTATVVYTVKIALADTAAVAIFTQVQLVISEA